MKEIKRSAGRQWDELRKVSIVPGYVKNATGSCLVTFGNTQVITTAMLESEVPAFAQEKNIGWVTAQYAMLPGSTLRRKARDILKTDGRSVEIQRLIGRAMRGGIDLKKFPGYTLYIDADVLNADGGTRCASITGAFVSASLAFKKLLVQGKISENPVLNYVAAVSVGLVNGHILLDLEYEEDSKAYCDMNVIADENSDIVDIQASGEGSSFKKYQFDKMLNVALNSIPFLIDLQKKTVENFDIANS